MVHSIKWNILININKDIAEDYIKLIWFDTLVYNVDRHNQNYGLLRHKNNGKIIGLAPNFDNNIALIAVNKSLDQKPEFDGLIKEFTSFIKENEDAKKIFKNLNFPLLVEETIDKCFKEINIQVNEDKIKKFIMNRYDFLMNYKSRL